MFDDFITQIQSDELAVIDYFYWEDEDYEREEV